MKARTASAILLVVGALALNAASAQEPRNLEVHLAQANNDSPYAFVRAKFEPGELADPWAVRFFDDAGAEIPYFVWDSLTWRVAREGRSDWGRRYAQLNHAAGDSDAVSAARGEKIAWANQHMPALGTQLAAQDEAAKKAGESVCAAMYLLRYRVPAFGKRRVVLRIFDQSQVKPNRLAWQGPNVSERVAVNQGDLSLRGLPDQLSVLWKGEELFHCGGFDAGGATGTVSHSDPARPFTVEATAGIITRLLITGQTRWRQDASMDWQCTYWLFPEGGYVALEGFSLGDPGSYLGGHQKLSLFAPPNGETGFSLSH